MSVKNKVIRVADYILSRIADKKIKEVFYLPGGGAMYLNDALFCEKRITPVICHHEQACGIAAEANGRTNKAGFGVVIVTTGPGATNVLTPVAGAWIESLPMLIISGQVKRSDALEGRLLRQGGVQEVDIVSIVKPITKYAVTIKNPKDVRYCLEKAFWHMTEGRAGPVWLDVPLDVQAAPIDKNQLKSFNPPLKKLQKNLNVKFDLLANLLKKAERPLLLIGHGVRIAGAKEPFKNLIKKFNIPAVFTWNASDLIHWDHPLYIGRPGVVAARAPNLAIQNSDLLITIGCRLDNVLTAYNPKGFARHAKKIVVDIDSNEISKHEMPIELSFCMDAKLFIRECLVRVKYKNKNQSWINKCLHWKIKFPPLDGRVFDKNKALSHYQFIDSLSDVIPPNKLIVTGSSGLAMEVFYTVFRNKFNQRVFLTSGLGSMGYGVPAAIGACYGAGKVSTICIESDGSLMLNLQELITLKSQNLPIILIVMNNGGYASIRNTQKNYFNGRYLGTGISSGLLIPNLLELSSAIDLPFKRIVNGDNVIEELRDVISQPGPFICEVILENEEILSPKVAAIPQPDGSIISMPLEDMSPLLPREELKKQMLVPLDPASEKVKF